MQLEIPAGVRNQIPAELQQLLRRSLEDIGTPQPKTVGLSKMFSEEDVRYLEQCMSPKSTWLDALAWSMLEAAQQLKQRADELLVQGDFLRAADRYRLLHKVTEQRVLSELSGMPSYPASATIPAGLLARTILDALATVGFVYLRIGEFRGANEASSVIRKVGNFLNNLSEAAEIGLSPEGEAAWLAHPGFIWSTAGFTFVMGADSTYS